jgi:hypothetical protein
MLIIDRQIVEIDFVPAAGANSDLLRLTYRQQSYDFVQAFSIDKLTAAINAYQTIRGSDIDGFLLIREAKYYSLWRLVRGLVSPPIACLPITKLQRSGLWFFQELWLRLDDLLGNQQVQVIGQNLLASVPQIPSWEGLEMVLEIDPSTMTEPQIWTDRDIITVVRLIHGLTQTKLGDRFTTEIIESILLDMPLEFRGEIRAILSA